MGRDRIFCKVAACGFYNEGIVVRQGFIFSEASRSALGSTKPPIPWILGLYPKAYRARDVKLWKMIGVITTPPTTLVACAEQLVFKEMFNNLSQ